MTPEHRAKLELRMAEYNQGLNPGGLSVLMTRDYDEILLQLAQLAQFQRLLLTAAAGNPAMEFAVEHVQREQAAMTDSCAGFAVPLEILNIPTVLQAVNVELQKQLDATGTIHLQRLPAAVTAFSAILCGR